MLLFGLLYHIQIVSMQVYPFGNINSTVKHEVEPNLGLWYNLGLFQHWDQTSNPEPLHPSVLSKAVYSPPLPCPYTRWACLLPSLGSRFSSLVLSWPSTWVQPPRLLVSLNFLSRVLGHLKGPLSSVLFCDIAGGSQGIDVIPVSAHWHLLALVRACLLLQSHSSISAGVLEKASQWQFPTPFKVPKPSHNCSFKVGGHPSYFMEMK